MFVHSGKFSSELMREESLEMLSNAPSLLELKKEMECSGEYAELFSEIFIFCLTSGMP